MPRHHFTESNVSEKLQQKRCYNMKSKQWTNVKMQYLLFTVLISITDMTFLDQLGAA